MKQLSFAFITRKTIAVHVVAVVSIICSRFVAASELRMSEPCGH
jgi:hypothetical protein